MLIYHTCYVQFFLHLIQYLIVVKFDGEHVFEPSPFLYFDPLLSRLVYKMGKVATDNNIN